MADLNALYRREPALHQLDFDWHGFEWIDCHNYQDSILAYVRKAKDPNDYVIVCHNFTPVPRHNYRIGVPEACWYQEIANSDSTSLRGERRGQRRRHPGAGRREPRPSSLADFHVAAAVDRGVQAAAISCGTTICRLPRPVRLPAG